MILLVHMLFGAAIGSLASNIWVAILLAFLGHYFLDFIPHVEYSIKNLEEKNWKQSLPDFAKVFCDFCLGIFTIYIFSKNQSIIYICAIIAILPDATTLLGWMLPHKLLAAHFALHEKIHYFKYKKLSKFWRVLTQATVTIICILILRR